MKLLKLLARLGVLTIILAIHPAAEATVYLKTNSTVNQANPEWWAYTWTNDVIITDEQGNQTTTPGSSTWTQGTTSDNETYTFDIDGSTGYNVIFVRMNPSASNRPSWDAAWNQSEDLTLINNATYVLGNFVENSNRITGQWQLPETQPTGKPVWQQADATQDNYLTNRRALTGRHCMVNKMVSVVDVGNWVSGLDNMVDEDLTNVAVFPAVATVGVGAKPITSVRDTRNHYAAGTTAGFSLVASSGASVLTLGVANAWTISFYLEGKLMATKAVTNGQTAGGVGLSLIKIPGSDEVTLDLSATAPCEFDEISLMPTGLASVEAVTNTRIKYAFVGDYKTYTITETSMQQYATAHGRQPFTLDQGQRQIWSSTRNEFNTQTLNYENGHWAGSDLINDNLEDGVVWGVLSIGANLDCRVGAAISPTEADQSMPFKAGSTVGFKVAAASLLKLPVGTWAKIRLFKGEWKKESHTADFKSYDYAYVQTEVQEETINANVLALSIASGGEQFPTITANQDFSHVEITFYTVLSVDLGGMKGFYAFVNDPPEVMHECDLHLSADASLCSKDTQYQLTASPDINVTWAVTNQPSGASAQVDATGKVTGMTVDGVYEITATAPDGCSEVVMITKGLELEPNSCDIPLFNYEDDSDYELSTTVRGNGGALIRINENLQDSENVLTPTLDDYAMYNNLLNGDVADNLPIVGVKLSNGTFNNGRAHRIGFVVEAQSTGLTAEVIDLFNIRTYSNSTQTSSNVIKETNSIKVKLIGSHHSQKLRFAVDIPADVTFDEFVLWKSGVLSLSIERFKIYYAFVEEIDDENEPTTCFDPIGCAATMVNYDDGARIDGNNSQFAGAVNAAIVADNLTYLIDNDITTGVSISNSVSLGDGIVLAIDLGKVYPTTKQVGLILDSKTYLAGVKAGEWITLATFLNGVEQERQSDWSVLGVNAIGYGDKSYIFLNPTKPYDAIRITIGDIVDLLDFDTKYFGIFVRDDYDNDGTPNCKDDDSCIDEYTLDEEATALHKDKDYLDGNLVLHRSMILNDWNCIVLPVDLTWLQVRNAFGNEVEIDRPNGFCHADIDGARKTELYYLPLTGEDNTIALHKGDYYMIRPKRLPDLTEGTYTARGENVTVNAPVYFIPSVTYDREIEAMNPGGMVPVKELFYHEIDENGNPVNHAPIRRAEGDNETIVLHGSQVHLDGVVNEKVAQGNYVYAEYLDKVKLEQTDEDTEMLGFRFYVENNSPYPIIDRDDDGIITGVSSIIAPKVVRNGVYTIDGRCVRTDNSTSGLAPGVYIVGGAKVVVR